MRLLLDTHILLWAFAAPRRLGSAMRDELESPDNVVLFSTISIWEIAIKSALGKPDFLKDPADILIRAREVGFRETSITPELAIAASRLPNHHRDPFDRMIVAQAMSEPARLVTADRVLARYSELIWLV